MARSFDLVDIKVAQANFFLGRLARSLDNAFEFHCFLSAFVSSCRSITYVLQSVMAGTPGFSAWYTERQEQLRNSQCARYFHSVRRMDHHVGTMVLGPGRIDTNQYASKDVKFSFAASNDDPMPPAPQTDVLSACHQYYDEVAQVVNDCCVDFRIPIDPKLHFTQMNFDSLGESLSDAMEEVLGDSEAYLPELQGINNQWLLLRELVWSTDLYARFEALKPKSAKESKKADTQS